MSFTPTESQLKGGQNQDINPEDMEESSAIEEVSTRRRWPLVALFRAFFATLLIIVSLWALLLPPIFPYSTHALINTKVVSIRAPEAGHLTSTLSPRLTEVGYGNELAKLIRDPEAIRRQAREVRMARDTLAAQLSSLETIIDAQGKRLEETRAEFDATLETNRLLRSRSQGDAEERLRSLAEELAERRAIEAKVAPLYEEGIVTFAQWSRTRSETLQAERAYQEATIALTAYDEAHGSLSMSEPAREALDRLVSRSLSQEQEIERLNLRRLDLVSRIEEEEARLKALKSDEERASFISLSTPIDGIVWRTHAVPGERLSSDQLVAEIAHRESLFVEAYFRRDFMNAISVGNRASIFLVGQRRFVSGQVVDVQAQERTSREPDLIQMAPLDTGMLRVVIAPDSGSIEPYQLGSLAKVLITSENPGPVERGALWLSLILRSHK